MVLNRCKDVVIRLSQLGVNLGPRSTKVVGHNQKGEPCMEPISWEVSCVRGRLYTSIIQHT